MSTLDDEILRHVCRCSHHRDTHFLSKEACLGVLCDCKEYRDDTKPDPEGKRS